MSDPAFLFYSQDWLVGTNLMSWEDRGKYITLLAQMHQSGRLDEETIRFLVGSVSVKLKEKFCIDSTGKWYNERLELEANKRKKFTESRRLNGSKGGRPNKNKTLKDKKHLHNHMVNHMGNENDNENVNNIIERYNKIPGIIKCQKTTKERKKLVEARISENDLETMHEVLNIVEESDFLTGKVSDWKCNFDWLFKKSNFLKVLEGNYNNKNKQHGKIDNSWLDEFESNSK